ncbi:unnamed protein product [Amaranthus hypochondriacus]
MLRDVMRRRDAFMHVVLHCAAASAATKPASASLIFYAVASKQKLKSSAKQDHVDILHYTACSIVNVFVISLRWLCYCVSYSCKFNTRRHSPILATYPAVF